jgi:DHA2 family multidrug resistance protein
LALGAYDTTTREGLARLDHLVTRQAHWLAYSQDFKMMLFISLATLPVLVLIRPPKRRIRDMTVVVD